MSASERAPAQAQPEVLLRLRQATAPRHDEIESLLALDRIDDRRRLVLVLQVFDAFLAAWEPRIARALPAAVKAWFEPHRRGAWAARDLAVLEAPRTAALDAPEIELDSPAAAMGSLYVLEGSALGGRIIARALHERLHIDEASGALFFGGRAADTGRIWREFTGHLAATVQDGASIDAACRAADCTFAALARQFRPALAAA